MQELLFIKGVKDKANAFLLSDTLTVVTRATSLGSCGTRHTRSRIVSPLIVSVSNHRLALGTKAKEEEGCRAGGSGGGGVGQLGEGEKRGKISFRALRLPVPLTHSD